MFATTYIKGKIVYYYLYSPYRSTQTVSALLAKHKLNVAALLQANKKMARAPGRDQAWHLAAGGDPDRKRGCPVAARTDPGRSP